MSAEASEGGGCDVGGARPRLFVMTGWAELGLGWDGTGWDGTGWDGTGWDRMGWTDGVVVVGCHQYQKQRKRGKKDWGR